MQLQAEAKAVLHRRMGIAPSDFGAPRISVTFPFAADNGADEQTLQPDAP